MASAMATKCSKNLEAMSSQAGSSRASSRAISSRVTQKKPIHAVPSACSSVPPPGSGRERSNTPTLSRPRKPPPKRWFPSLSLRFTHQVKLRQSFWKRRERRSEEHTSELQSRLHLVCRLLLEKKKK